MITRMRLLLAFALLIMIVSSTVLSSARAFRHSAAGALPSILHSVANLQSSSEPQTDSDHHGTVQGNVVDPEGKPVYAIDVSLIPIDKTGDDRWRGTYRDWTNRDGSYLFNRVSPGKYVLGVHAEGAPSEKHPFATIYYPGFAQESIASNLIVENSKTLELQTLRLQRLETAVIKVHVVWNDGRPVERSNLLFHNPSYPQQGVIGNGAPQIENGEGEFIAPKGFKYYARAKVD